jgi:ankyrin repeat protein
MQVTFSLIPKPTAARRLPNARQALEMPDRFQIRFGGSNPQIEQMLCRAARNGDLEALNKYLGRLRQEPDLFDINGYGLTGFNALQEAASNGQVEATKLLLAAGANKDCPSRTSGRSALMISLQQEQPETANLLLDARANTEYVTKSGESVLGLAADVLKSILERKNLGQNNATDERMLTVTKRILLPFLEKTT